MKSNTKKPVTFEQLPEAVSQLFDKLENIEKLLLSINANLVPQQPKENILTIEQAAEFLGLAISTIHTMVNRAEIPSYKAGKRLYFIEEEIRDWIKSGRKKTVKELEAEADSYIKDKRQ